MTHPERLCERCGGPNLMCWHAPSPLWNTVMRDSEGRERYGVVCPRCFGELAQEKGVADFFCLTTHDPKVELPKVSPGGRVWDADQCMWLGHRPRPTIPPSVEPGGFWPWPFPKFMRGRR